MGLDATVFIGIYTHVVFPLSGRRPSSGKISQLSHELYTGTQPMCPPLLPPPSSLLSSLFSLRKQSQPAGWLAPILPPIHEAMKSRSPSQFFRSFVVLFPLVFIYYRENVLGLDLSCGCVARPRAQSLIKSRTSWVLHHLESVGADAPTYR